MVSLDQYKAQIEDFKPVMERIRKSLDLDTKQRKIEEMELNMMEEPGFWERSGKAARRSRRSRKL